MSELTAIDILINPDEATIEHAARSTGGCARASLTGTQSTRPISHT
jgi:hypothetical protein